MVAKYQGRIPTGLKHQNPDYAAMIETLDDNIGRILQKLKQRKLVDHTLVIFTSDNGGTILQHNGRQVTDNSPLRSGKGSLYEGGIRVPLIMRLPGVTTPGVTCAESVLCTDFFPTIVELCGIKVTGRTATKGPLDGQSLLPLLRRPDSRLNRDALFFHYPHYYATTTPVSAVRVGDWKLLEYFEDHRVELHNLRDDPGEQRNLAAGQADRVQQLRDRLHQWWDEVGAKLPSTP